MCRIVEWTSALHSRQVDLENRFGLTEQTLRGYDTAADRKVHLECTKCALAKWQSVFWTELPILVLFVWKFGQPKYIIRGHIVGPSLSMLRKWDLLVGIEARRRRPITKPRHKWHSLRTRPSLGVWTSPRKMQYPFLTEIQPNYYWLSLRRIWTRIAETLSLLGWLMWSGE